MPAQRPLGGTDQLHDGYPRRTSVGAGTAFDAFHDLDVFHLFVHPGFCQPGQSGGVEEVGAGFQAASAADAGVFLGACCLGGGEGEDPGAALDDRGIQAGDGGAHHGAAHDDFPGVVAQAPAVAQHFPHRRAQGDDQIGRSFDAGAGDGDHAVNVGHAGVEPVRNGGDGADVVHDDAQIRRVQARGDFDPEQGFDHHLGIALGILDPQGHDAYRLVGPELPVQDSDGVGLVALDADDGLGGAQSGSEDLDAPQQSVRTLDHEPVVVGEIVGVLSFLSFLLSFPTFFRLLQAFEGRDQFWNIVLYDAPKGVVVDAKVGMDEAVAGRDDLAPRNIWVCGAHALGNSGSGLADKLQVAQGRIIGEPVRDETLLVQVCSIGEYLARKVEHIADVETPFALARFGLRHESLPAR